MAKVDELVADIEQRIRTGQLGPGDRLPPVRTFAADRGLAANTAAAVYRKLAERGLVQGEGRRGTFVTAKPAVRAPLNEPVPSHLVDLANGNPDPSLLPDLGPALARVPTRHLLYGGDQNVEPLVARFAEGFAADGIPPGDVAVVGGALDGIERVLGAHLRPGDQGGIEDPGYAAVRDLVTAMGYRPTPVAVDPSGPDPASLARAVDAGISAVVITPRAQNPTGCTVTPERAGELARVLGSNPHVVVIEDDHAGPITGADHHSSVSARSARWAVVRSVAKVLGPDLRVSALIGDPTTLGRVRGRQAVGTGWVSHILQHLALTLLDRPDHEAVVRRATEAYADRRRAFQDRLADEGIATSSTSGLNVWIPVPDEATVVAAMERRGFAIRSGADSRMAAPPGVRVTIAGQPSEVLVEAADALVDVLRPRRPARQG